MKMMVADLDGTLLRNDKTLSQRTKQVLAQLRQRGVKVVYATGRGDSALTCAPTELFDGCIRMNGAVAFMGDRPIYNKRFPLESIRDLLVEATARSRKAAVEVGDKHHSNFDVTAMWPSIKNYEIADFKTFCAEIEKAYFVMEHPSDRAFISDRVPKNLFLYSDNDGLAFVSHEDAVKSKAVHALASHWGIASRDIVAFGDGENDIDLLMNCGVGVAMGNASEAVKRVADHLCNTNENDGVARWIENAPWFRTNT